MASGRLARGRGAGGRAAGGQVCAGSWLYVVQAGLVSRHRASELVRRLRSPGAGLPGVFGEVVPLRGCGLALPRGSGVVLGRPCLAGGVYAAMAAVWLMVPAAILGSQAVRLVVML
jgi:hypothetical protein